MNQQPRIEGLESFEHRDMMEAILAVQLQLTEIEELGDNGRDTTRAVENRDNNVKTLVQLVDKFIQQPPRTNYHDITKPFINDEIRHIIREVFVMIDTLDTSAEDIGAQIKLKGAELGECYKRQVLEANTEEEPIWRPAAMYDVTLDQHATVPRFSRELSPAPDLADVSPTQGDARSKGEGEDEDEDSEEDLEWAHKIEPGVGDNGFAEALVGLMIGANWTARLAPEIQKDDESEYWDEDEDEVGNDPGENLDAGNDAEDEDDDDFAETLNFGNDVKDKDEHHPVDGLASGKNVKIKDEHHPGEALNSGPDIEDRGEHHSLDNVASGHDVQAKDEHEPMEDLGSGGEV